MNESIDRTLKAVLRRQRRNLVLRCLLTGLFFGELFVLLLLLTSITGIFGDFSVWSLTLICLLTGFLIGLFCGLAVRIDRATAARTIDTQFGLKDRILTALTLSRTDRTDPMARLQQEDAAKYLAQIQASSIKLPSCRKAVLRTVLTCLPVLLFCFSFPLLESGRVSVSAEPVPELLELVDSVEDELVKKLEILAKQLPDERILTDLHKKMEQLAARLDTTTSDPKETLAIFSEMEESLRQTMTQFDLESEKQALKDIGAALSESSTLQFAGNAMQSGNWGEACKALENIDPEKIAESDRKRSAGQLKQISSNLKKKGRNADSELSAKLGESLEQRNTKESKALFSKLGTQIKRHKLRNGICKSLFCNLVFLGICKSNCSGYCSNKLNSGQGNKKSNSPGKSWGRGVTDDPRTGQDSKLDSNRVVSSVSGKEGDGPSEIETLESDEANGSSSARPYSEVYREYQKMSESVLESEPIPPGNRQVIRRYFESIRPKDGK